MSHAIDEAIQSSIQIIISNDHCASVTKKRMSSLTLIPPIVLLLTTAPWLVHSSINPCLYNREDVTPCLDHFNTGVVSPGPNEYTIHATRLQLNPVDGSPICVKRKEGEIVRNIQNLGTPSIKFLFSPGAEQEPRMNYTNQICVEYNVQCEPAATAFIKFDTLDLEPANCHDGNQFRCQDYVTIDTDTSSMEYCGNVVPPNPFIVGTGMFTLKFRSSFFDSYPGFRIFVTCLSGEESEQNERSTCSKPDPEKSTVTTVELIDLTEESLRNRRKTNSLPMTLTSAEMRTIDYLADSLFTVALGNARRRATHWPPASYLKDNPGDLDILDLIKSSPIASQTLSPVRRKRRLLTRELKEPTGLDSGATMEAVMNENACNPIVRSVARSYISVAERIDPIQLRQAQQEVEKLPQSLSKLS